MTIAERISALLDDDPDTRVTSEGRTLEQLIDSFRVCSLRIAETGLTRYVFLGDSSVIVDNGKTWEIGAHPDCFCVASDGHDSDCHVQRKCEECKGEGGWRGATICTALCDWCGGHVDEDICRVCDGKGELP